MKMMKSWICSVTFLISEIICESALHLKIFYSIDTENFRYFLFQAWGGVVVAHRARQKQR